MPISDDMRRLEKRWEASGNWPKRLEWIEIQGLHGWTGQRFDFRFPIMAVTGENGVGKSTVLQCAASVYQHPDDQPQSFYASDFFPDTAWEHIRNASIRFAGREGSQPIGGELRKPGERWRGNPERPRRWVHYIDLRRLQPVPARVGYASIAKGNLVETRSMKFDDARRHRLSQIMARDYELARMSFTTVDDGRATPVLGHNGAQYSGFHQGAGETIITELLQHDFQDTALILIDEIESSLHPRAQRRLVKDLATLCREKNLQIVLTTHSPYVLDEIPPQARAYIMHAPDGRNIVYGVSPDFAMSRMDDVGHFECDLYVEDKRGVILLTELLAHHSHDLLSRCRMIDYGAASVGKALGQMAERQKFPRPSCVFVDGDQGSMPGCISLPGDDAPERVIFSALKAGDWMHLADRIRREYSLVADECSQSMLLADHHDWVVHAASRLHLGGDILWQVMCSEWAASVSKETIERVAQPIQDALDRVVRDPAPVRRVAIPATEQRVFESPQKRPKPASDPGPGLFEG